MLAVSARYYGAVTSEHLDRLAGLAAAERERFVQRWPRYGGRFLQGYDLAAARDDRQRRQWARWAEHYRGRRVDLTRYMPAPVREYAADQPVSATANAVRSLLIGGPTTTHVLVAIAWSIGLVAVFAPLAVHSYRRAG